MAKDNSLWRETIRPSKGNGFAPAFWSDTYPEDGNKNDAGDMTNCDINNPKYITQGPGLATLTAGTEAAAIKTLLKFILNQPTSTGVTWGIGGNKLYKIGASAVVNDGTFPKTIDKGTVTAEDGESVCSDGTYLYTLYNHSGSAGDIGRLTLADNTWDADFGSTVPTGAAALEDAPHPSVLGNDGIVYFGNGPYVGYYDPLTDVISVDELDLPPGSQVVDLVYENSRIYLAVNFPNLTGTNTNIGIIYVWDTVSSSWDDFPNPRTIGRIGALLGDGQGQVYVWYYDLTSTGGYKLGVLEGSKIRQLRSFTGSLINFGQKCIYDNMLAWISGGQMWVWGAKDSSLPVKLSQFADGGFLTVGALAVPFGTPMLSSHNSTTGYKLAKLSGYDVNCDWKSLMFSCPTSEIDKIIVHFEPTATGARCDLLVRYNRGASNQAIISVGQTGSITHTNDSKLIQKAFSPSISNVQDWRIELSWASGSVANPIKIRMIEVFGHFIEKEYA